MEKYTEERSDIFFTGADGTLRSNRTLAQVAGLYAIDSFLGATLQMDYYGNSSTVTGRLSGFGGAPNMGHNPGGRRHSSPAYHSLVEGKDTLRGGQKIVIQMLKSSGKKGNNFVPELDAIAIGRDAGMEAPPIMVYGEDVSHTVTEQGIAYCYMAEDAEERKLMLASIAQGTPFGEMVTKEQIEAFRKAGKVAYPEDLGIDRAMATKDLLACKNLEEIAECSGGLYVVPEKFRKKD